MKRNLLISALILLLGAGLLSFQSLPVLPRKFLQALAQQLESYNQKLPQEKIYVQTDKAFYKPGEDIWFNAFVVNGTDHTSTTVSDIVYVELINPKGSVEHLHTLPVKSGMASGDFALDETLPGGLYKIRAYTQWMKNFGEDTFFEKEIQVQKIITPRVLLKLDFKKETYGPSDQVIAELNIKNLQNEPIARHTVKVMVQLAGSAFLQQTTTTNETGLASIQFNLPDKLATSDGLLTAIVDYEGKTESISRSIPIILNKIDLQFFPEGGQLVENVPGKVAFKALNEFGKPADISGIVLNEKGHEVASFESFHQGMGAFTFTPKPNVSYKIKLTKPVGINQEYTLPAAVAKGYTLSVETVEKDKLKVQFHAPAEKELYLVAQVRGQIYFSEKLQSKAGTNQLTVPLQKFPIGIAQVTLFDHNQIPRCERLVFVNSHKKLKVQITTNKKQYVPREKVELTIRTQDEDSLPVPAQLSLSVVDDKLISFADDKQDNILSALLMSSDLKGEIEEPNFYFDPSEPKANQALDFVLMTHGWRRFTWKEVLENDPGISFYPEKTGTIAGTIYNAKTNTPQAATVTLFELSEGKRAAQVKTKADGSFVFLDVDPTAPMQIFAEGPFVKNQHLSIRLDQNVAQSYGIQPQNKVPQEVTFDSNIIEEVADEVEVEEELVMLDTEITEEKPIAAPVVGEEPQAIGNQNFSLQADVQSLSEVVVVGYSSQSRRDLTGAVTTVQESDFNTLPHSSPEQVLQGRVAGVQVMPNGSMSGEGASVRMYGMRSMANSEPLYVIDGYPVQISINASFSTSGFVSPNEIQSISVIKSPGADAIYGGGAINGVIIITTKKGDYRPSHLNNGQRNLSSLLISPRKFTQVREFYAPVYDKQTESKVRTDFRSTIYWNSSLQTDDRGEAKLSFYNSDEVTAFRITAEGIAVNGLVGRTEQEYFTQLLFSLDAKIPPFLTFEDITEIPLFLRNNTFQAITGKLNIELPAGLQFTQTPVSEISLAAQEARTVYISCKVLNQAGKDSIQIRFEGPDYQDAIYQEIEVSPKGFPTELSVSDKKLEKSFSFHINEPMPGSIKAELKAYPDILTDLVSGIESIFREPYGCFEQTSSSTYPNILALQYLRETGQGNVQIEAQALKYIKQGYKRLISFETRENGFEWFGGTPPHEGLTAYGLMEFMEMRQVYDGVSQAMIERTKEWLLSRKDGKGGFKQNRGSHGFEGASREVNNAYVVYALSEARIKNIDREYESAYAEVLQSKDPYRMALLSLASFNLNEAKRGTQLTAELIAKLSKHSFDEWKIASSIVYSQGKSLQMETASLFALALLKSPQPDVAVLQKTIDYLVSNRAFGGFGSTQATILSLKALTEFAKFSKHTAESGTMVVYHQHRKIGTASYEKDSREELRIEGIEKYLQAGRHDFKVLFADTKEPLPYSLNVSWNSYTPNSSKNCQVDLQTNLSASSTQTGKTLRLHTVLKNKSKEGLPMTVALIGIPSGLSPQPWQLKELQEKKIVDFYEVRQNYVVFYFRELAPKAEHEINLDLKAEIPGTYQAQASTAYLYYTSEFKDWEAGESVEILR